MGHLLLLLLALLMFFNCHLACAAYSSTAATPVCAGAPVVVLLEPLAFCGIVGASCCDPAADAALGEEYRAMKVPESDAACATIVRAILCERCIANPSPQPPVNDVTIRSVPPRCASPRPSSVLPQPQQDAVCLERLAGGGAANYKGMAAHPEGSGRAFLYTQDGKIWIASVPARGSGAAMQVAPFVDLTDRPGLVLMVLALHPQFAINGRFFVSYACAACGDAGGTSSCRNQLVLVEFSNLKLSGYGTGTEVNRIFTMDLPLQLADSSQQHGGQIFFRPGFGYLYLVAGHGGSGDEAATSPFLGKIIRFDVDGRTAAGKYEPQIFATGLWDPMGCSFDPERTSYLYCAAVDENEQVYLISNKQLAANHSVSSSTAMAAAVSLIISHGRPTPGEAPSIVGGIVYRGSADPFLHGRYMYIYRSSVWAAAETPAAGTGGLHEYASARISGVRCSRSSPVPCGGVDIAGSIVSLAQDDSKDVFVIATGGIYRVIPPGLCGGGGARPSPATRQQIPSWLTALMSILGLVTFSATSAIFWCLCGGGGGGGGGTTTIHKLYVMVTCCFRGEGGVGPAEVQLGVAE